MPYLCLDPFAVTMWLDGNQLTGISPTIETAQELASLSLADNRLSGRIPDQMGNLRNLQRVWLNQNQLTGEIPTSLERLTKLEVLEFYNNALTGEMPMGICDIFAGVTYQLKALTSDCRNAAEVDCKPDCCTQCF